jgi:enoyl-CoA hydratase
MSENVKVTVEKAIAIISIDRPPVNAMNTALRRELTEIFGEMEDRDDVKVVILTGAANIFCGGMDLKEHRSHVHKTGDGARSEHDHRSFTNSLRECSKPIIAALNGPAVGTGVNIAAACDIILASNNAWMAMPEIGVGIPNGASGLVRLFGQSKGRRMFFTGQRVDARELYRLGVIEACVPREDLMAHAMDIAADIAAQDMDTLIAAKHCYNLAQEVPFAIAKNMEYVMTRQLSRKRAKPDQTDPSAADTPGGVS